MRSQVVLAMVFIIFASSQVVLATAENERPKMPVLVSPDHIYHTFEQRTLRTSETNEAIDGKTDERSLLKWTKVRYWLETEKTDEYVLKALQLNGMNEATMKLQENYKYYTYFAKKSVDYRINSLVLKHTTTWNVWEKLGLHKKAARRNELISIRHTPEYDFYKRYVKAFDSYVMETLKAGYSTHFTMVSKGTSDAEMYARIRIMADDLTSDQYAKVLLGLTDHSKRYTATLKGIQLTNHKDYHWFKLFMKLREESRPKISM